VLTHEPPARDFLITSDAAAGHPAVGAASAATMSRVRRGAIPLVGAVVALASFAACSRSYDGWFANPCAEDLKLEVLYADRDSRTPAPSDEVIVRATLTAEAVTKVDDAFQDVRLHLVPQSR
jgi:hypothetical protein